MDKCIICGRTTEECIASGHCWYPEEENNMNTTYQVTLQIEVTQDPDLSTPDDLEFWDWSELIGEDVTVIDVKTI